MRPWWYRAVAAALSLWLVALIAEPAALHRCPMHDGTAAAGAPAGAMDHAHMADHGSTGAHHHACTCLGDCANAWAATLPPITVGAPIASVTVARRTVIDTANAAFRPSAPEHARPPSTPPPALHLV